MFLKFVVRVRDEYDNYICHTCKERELETPLFQNYRCVEECDNKTYYTLNSKSGKQEIQI